MSSITDHNGLLEAGLADRQPRESRWLAPHARIPLSALLQLAGFFAVALTIDHVFLESNRFAGTQPHPFWIPVILLSLQFGTGVGLLAALTASVGLLLGNLPEQMLSEDRFGYLLHLSAVPLYWLTAALVIGALRSRQLRHTRKILEKHQRLVDERNTIAEAYQTLKHAKTGLEMQVAGQTRTLAATCEALAGVNLSIDAVLESAHRVVHGVLSPRAFSLFLINGDTLRGVSNEGWRRDTRFVGRFDEHSALYRSVIEQERILCVARPEDEAVLGGQGILAGPFRDMGTGEVLGMLKIEDFEFQDLTPDMLGVFKGVCDWIGIMITNHRHLTSLAQGRLGSEDSPLLAPEAYDRLAHFLITLGQRLEFQTVILTVSAPKTLALRSEGLKQFATVLAEAAVEIGGPSVLVFDRQEDDLDYVILLPHRARDNAILMTEALRQAVLRRLDGLDGADSKMLSVQLDRLNHV